MCKKIHNYVKLISTFWEAFRYSGGYEGRKNGYYITKGNKCPCRRDTIVCSVNLR
jgi:hypothetical protein